MSNTYSAGVATAYGAAVRGGYTGTYAEWCAAMADFGDKSQQAIDAAEQAAQSATDAANSATDAADSASSAETFKGNAEDSAAAAHNSETNAAASESAAAQSANAAAGSATAAATSEANAAASAAAAQAVKDSIPADYTELSNDVDDIKSAISDYIYGSNKTFSVTGGKVNKFKMLLLNGIKYTVTNNTGVNVNVILFKADDTQKVITWQLTNGASISFTPDSDEYTQIGGFVNANPTGTFDVICGYSDLENGEKIISADKLLNEVTKNIDANITDKVTKHENQFYNVNNVIYTGGNQWNYYTFPVSEGDTFTIDTVAGQTVRAWAFRDAGENQLSIASYNGDVVQKEYTDIIAPANAVELIVNFKHVSGYLTIIKNGEAVLNENRIYYNGIELPKYLDKINELAEEKFNILHGKVLCCCGDSITYGADMDSAGIIATPTIESYQWSGYTKTWTRWTADEPATYGYQIAARNRMIFYNGGVSGATVQAKSGSITVPGFSDADGEYTLLPNEIDYLTLFYGWNDTAVGTLGNISDTTNNSYYGAYNVVMPYLINKYPYTKIALIVPFGTDVGHRQAIRELADKWGVACFDMMQGGTPLYYGKEPSVDVDADIVTANRAKFQANGAHPNYRGHYQIGTMLEHFLRGI